MKVRGGMLLARALQEKGVTRVFTLSGGFCNPALEGFMECGIAVLNAPHEQVAGHLADGHTRITRQPAVCLVGPEGFAAAVPAMMEAWGECSPVIFVTGSSTLKREGSGGFKEIDDVSIEAGLLSYGNELTRANNPLEWGLERFCQLDGSIDCLGLEALQAFAANGPERLIRGVLFDGERCPPCRYAWPVSVGSRRVGAITSAIWSPRFKLNVALAMLERDYWEAGTAVAVDCGDGIKRAGVVSDLPMEER